MGDRGLRAAWLIVVGLLGVGLLAGMAVLAIARAKGPTERGRAVADVEAISADFVGEAVMPGPDHWQAGVRSYACLLFQSDDYYQLYGSAHNSLG